MQTLRLGTVPYLNIEPFVRALRSVQACEVLTARPSRLLALRQTADLDLCLISASDLCRLEDEPLHGASIASNGAVASVVIVAHRPPHEWRRVALDSASSTSNRLARYLLENRFNLTPEWCLPRDPRAALDEGECDAAVIIGDRALSYTRAKFRIDLGEAWTDLTGLPFVYAAWLPGRRRRFTRADIEEVLEQARSRSCDWIEASVSIGARSHGIPRRTLYHYFRHCISYEFGPRERAGMRLFQRLSSETIEVVPNKNGLSAAVAIGEQL